MQNCTIQSISTVDARFELPFGAGTDSVHTKPEYCMAVTRLTTGTKLTGNGIALTLGAGNRLVCEAIELLATPIVGREIDELMSNFGSISRSLADDPSLRWLGPHKGVVHLALASITNACFDLWAKSRGVPLWKLLLDLTPEEVVRTLDLSYIEDVLSKEEALALLQANLSSRASRESVLRDGYPGYDTSVGWMAYDDQKVRDLTARAFDKGFRAFKLKVGSEDESRDFRRAAMLRDTVGDSGILMFDANQHWDLPTALRMCGELAKFHPLWIEEPTHPDDIYAHAVVARSIAPTKIAAGEHIPNRVLFKNFLHYEALHFVQADCTRLAGISEFLAVSLMARKFGRPIVPHVGDMGQLHQHLVLFNHIALDHEVFFLEHIPHLQDHFVFPARVKNGFYETPQEPGASSEMILAESEGR
jgi:L-fuconate dehydratase